MSYNPQLWQNLPNTTTPLNSNNLNRMEMGIYQANNVHGVDNYDNTATYNVGDYCIYNNTLYRCITAITVAEEFDYSKWEETSIAEILDADFFKPGDTFSGAWFYVDGYVTGGGTTLRFELNLPKSLDKISSVTINRMSVIGRGTSGYITGNSTAFSIVSAEFTTTATIRDSHRIYIQAIKDTAFPNITNNTPIAFDIRDYTISFNSD